jgi:hypothetical protein
MVGIQEKQIVTEPLPHYYFLSEVPFVDVERHGMDNIYFLS